jgi:hypothetical protein
MTVLDQPVDGIKANRFPPVPPPPPLAFGVSADSGWEDVLFDSTSSLTRAALYCSSLLGGAGG